MIRHLFRRPLVPIALLAALLLMSLAAAAGSYPLTITDAAGHKITFDRAPQRVASIFLGADEMLLALLPPERLVMISAFATDPTQSFAVDAAQKIPNRLQKADAEQILAVRPDVVFAAPFNDPNVLKQLSDLGVKVVQVQATDSIAEIEAQLLEIGRIVDAEPQSQALVAGMKTRLAALADQTGAISHKWRVLDYSPWQFTAGAGTTVDQTITAAGAINVAAEAKVSGWGKIGPEQIVAWNPDVIIYGDGSPGFGAQLAADPALQSVAAVKNHRIYQVPARDLGALSQHIVDAVYDLAQVLYPDVVGAK
ncbi:MAG TPA: ABC transporter substrate-binding protein [Limnochordia bacterium]|nr:ABC transporter substrate-binding protein [Limnochordia bacterium]